MWSALENIVWKMHKIPQWKETHVGAKIFIYKTQIKIITIKQIQHWESIQCRIFISGQSYDCDIFSLQADSQVLT